MIEDVYQPNRKHKEVSIHDRIGVFWILQILTALTLSWPLYIVFEGRWTAVIGVAAGIIIFISFDRWMRP